jgi:hypothetical protein
MAGHRLSGAHNFLKLVRRTGPLSPLLIADIADAFLPCTDGRLHFPERVLPKDSSEARVIFIAHLSIPLPVKPTAASHQEDEQIDQSPSFRVAGSGAGQFPGTTFKMAGNLEHAEHVLDRQLPHGAASGWRDDEETHGCRPARHFA